ncbi:MAG: fatty acyl-AMP ligase [Gammaproteobacteria bacterium]|nr:fatty acyl-AMP ligase [Gammaproteobacteria bacterium]
MDRRPTPTFNPLPFRAADFANLAEALDYAALGDTGCNFYSARGELYAALPYATLREDARALARRLAGLGLERGARLALVADTSPDFLRFFFACQYAGLVPVPVPVHVSLGSHHAYVQLLRGMLQSSAAAVAVAPAAFLDYLREAADGLGLSLVGEPAAFDDLPEAPAALTPSGPGELAYLQYTSGSTRFPRGVAITQESVLSNLAGIIRHGVQLRPGDRAVSWLPFYHDMGLVGLVLTPVAGQVSVDYLATRDFAMRPRQWLTLLSRSRATISFSPPFGYELCARRLRPGEAAEYDLSAWRVAGVGAEMINPEVLQRFAEAVAPSGFDPGAFLPCYGMAECALAVSFSPLGRGVAVDRVDSERLAVECKAVAVDAAESARVSTFVNCGAPIPDFEVEVRDEQGRPLADRSTGTIYLRGPSVMSGYFRDAESTRATLSDDGWLNTGDIGYRADGNLFVTGRSKDLMIVNGRNVWPQDLEYLAHQQPEVRPGDCLAFSVPWPDGDERVVMVVQSRQNDPAERADLVKRLQGLVRSEFGIECHVELVPPQTLPRTSSGKLSRSKARQNFIASRGLQAVEPAGEDSEPVVEGAAAARRVA